MSAIRIYPARPLDPAQLAEPIVVPELDPIRTGMPWVYHDGGRAQAGFKGDTGDCVTRAIAIATHQPYREVYDALNTTIKNARKGSKAARGSSRTGINKVVYHRYLAGLGWTWTPTMFIGSGTQVHLRPDELPGGTLIARLSKHLCAVVDGTIYDTYDPSRAGDRCVYGIYSPAN